MKPSLSFLLLFLPLLSFADSGKPWFRDAGEYITQRSVRMGIPTATTSLLNTDGKRFDANIGKRISLLDWGVQGPATAWTVGVDAGMLASLQRYKQNGRLTFATNTFDGFFGAFIGMGWDGWIALLRTAHLSAHLVDNSPDYLSPNSYSQFWEELIVGKTFPDPETVSDWDLHLQGSLGLNHTSVPLNKQPRAAFGMSYGKCLNGPNSLAALASADVLRSGVLGQKPTYTFFIGLGSLNRPDSTLRPFRAGLAFFRGSDYRNQYYNRMQSWTTFQVAAEL
jgi:hypothetical protein